MTDPLLEERIEILRRIAERGLALSRNTPGGCASILIDLWQHMLDEIGRLNPKP